jgi:hypothetical protein
LGRYDAVPNRNKYLIILDTNDLAYGHELFASIELIDQIDETKLLLSEASINDVIDLYIACQYVTSKARPTQWTDAIANTVIKINDDVCYRDTDD